MPAKQRKEKETEKMEVLSNYLYSWDQNPGESDQSYRLFLAFRDMGRTRSYIKIVDLFPQMNYKAINQLGHRLQWFKRAGEFDIHQDNEFMVKLEEEIIYSRIRQQRLGNMMSNLAEKGLEMLKEFPEELSPTEISKFAEIGQKIENLALGKSTSISESKVDAKVEVEVEQIPKEISEEIGKKLAILASEKMVISV